MKVDSVKLYQYALALKKPLRLKDHLIEKREGLIIQVTFEDNTLSFGEIAPLPGFSKETLDHALEQTKTFIPKLLNETPIENLCPSVDSGFSSAIDHSQKQCDVPVNALLQGTLSEVIDQTVDLLNKGFTTFKLKVGQENISSDIEKVQALQDIIHPTGFLRLDANQAWSAEQAREFAKAIGKRCLEYIEEPTNELKKITGAPFPMALDESLQNVSPERIEKSRNLKAIVLKPTLLGYKKTRQWIDWAKAHKINFVISSSFETGVGINHLIALAYENPETAAGLDTLKYFQDDCLKNSPTITRCRINSSENSLNVGILKEIAL